MNSNYSLDSQSLLLAVLEGLVDGVLLINPQGETLYANLKAQEVCQKLLPHQADRLPDGVWRLCESLIESRELYGDRPIILEDEIQPFRIRVQWLQSELYVEPCLLVRLEDQQQSLVSLAFAEAKKYGLTPREAEVWQLRRANLSRREIAEKLFITIDTVKKHLCNIQLKRQLHQESWC